MFRVVLLLDHCHYRTIGRFATYREARRVCRRALFKFDKGHLPFRPEVTRVEGGVYQTLNQPTRRNYGRETHRETGY